jgi:hypothetical protein
VTSWHYKQCLTYVACGVLMHSFLVMDKTPSSDISYRSEGVFRPGRHNYDNGSLDYKTLFLQIEESSKVVLQDGDEIDVESNGVGTLVNKVRYGSW